MLDSRARRFVEPVIAVVARACLRLGLGANQVTVLALLLGIAAAISVAAGVAVIGVALLWLSGLFDAADGAMARMTRGSALGAVLDVTFDRVVEMALIFALAWRHPEARLALVALAAAVAIAMSLFLSIAAAVENNSAKSFHYAPGLAERSEGFILLSLMALDPAHLRGWTWLFAILIGVTAIQRLWQARKVLRDADQADTDQG